MKRRAGRSRSNTPEREEGEGSEKRMSRTQRENRTGDKGNRFSLLTIEDDETAEQEEGEKEVVKEKGLMTAEELTNELDMAKGQLNQ